MPLFLFNLDLKVKMLQLDKKTEELKYEKINPKLILSQELKQVIIWKRIGLEWLDTKRIRKLNE